MCLHVLACFPLGDLVVQLPVTQLLGLPVLSGYSCLCPASDSILGPTSEKESQKSEAKVSQPAAWLCEHFTSAVILPLSPLSPENTVIFLVSFKTGSQVSRAGFEPYPNPM